MREHSESQDRSLGREPSHIVLIGEMGAGKTAVGSLLAEKLGRPLHDSDQMLHDRIGRTAAGFADSEGVEALHELELEVFLEAVSMTEAAVICPAASVLDSVAGRRALKLQVVIWLDVSIDTALERTIKGDHRRPVDSGEAEVLRRRRLEHYRSISDMRLDSETGEPKDLAAEIEEALPGLR